MIARFPAVRGVLPARNGRAMQSLVLFASTIVAMVATFFISVVTTRTLGATAYGDFKLITTLWTFLTFVSTLGYYQSSGRVLALERDPVREQEIVGVALLLALAMGGAVVLIIVLGAQPIDYLFRSQIAMVLVMTGPLVVTLALRDALTFILPSTNKVMLLAALNAVPAILYLTGLLVASRWTSLTVGKVLVLQQVSLLGVTLFIIWQLKPRFGALRTWLPRIARENTTFGWPVYVGSLVGVAVTYLNQLAIAYWVNTTAIGFYALSLNLVEPIKVVPSVVGTASFRDFAHQPQISRRVVWATMIVSVLFFVACLLLFGAPLSWVYTKDFAAVGPMARLAALGALFYGLGNFYNRFLVAHGEGNVLRKISYVAGGVNVVGFLVLVPTWKAWGGIATTVLVGGVYFVLTVFSYQRLLRRASNCERGSGLPSSNRTAQ